MSTRNKIIHGKLSNHTKSNGWFIGSFMEKHGFPDHVLNEIEVCWKKLEEGFRDPLHFHKLGTEIAVIISGWFSGTANGKPFKVKEQEYLIVYPYTNLEVTDYAIGTVMILIKTPSVSNDKYFVHED